MMSANLDIEKFLSAWWAIPSRFLEGWQTTVKEGLSPPWSKAYGRSVDAIESLAHGGFRMQADWCKMAIASVRSGSPEATAVGHWSAEAQSMVDSWSDASQQLTTTWCQMMKELPAVSWLGLPLGGPEGMMANVPAMRAMHDILQNSLKAQAAWISLLTPEMAAEQSTTGPLEAGREKPERKATPRKALETEQAA